MLHLAHQAVVADRRVVQGPGAYYGGVLVATSGGAATVDVYDGDSTSGELIASFSAAASGRNVDRPPIGIHFERYLYVDLGDNVSKFTVFYLENPDPPADPRVPGGYTQTPMGPMGPVV